MRAEYRLRCVRLLYRPFDYVAKMRKVTFFIRGNTAAWHVRMPSIIVITVSSNEIGKKEAPNDTQFYRTPFGEATGKKRSEKIKMRINYAFLI